MASLQTGRAGLGEDEARQRLERDGRNELPRMRQRGLLLVVLDQFRSPFILSLIHI